MDYLAAIHSGGYWPPTGFSPTKYPLSVILWRLYRRLLGSQTPIARVPS